MHVIQGGLQPEKNLIWNVEYPAGLQPNMFFERAPKNSILMHVIQSGLQPEENSIWNFENLAGLPHIIKALKHKEIMGYDPIYLKTGNPTRVELKFVTNWRDLNNLDVWNIESENEQTEK